MTLPLLLNNHFYYSHLHQETTSTKIMTTSPPTNVTSRTPTLPNLHHYHSSRLPVVSVTPTSFPQCPLVILRLHYLLTTAPINTTLLLPLLSLPTLPLLKPQSRTTPYHLSNLYEIVFFFFLHINVNV